MKIVTVNIPMRYIGAINKLIGENGLYPSRSELIRVAVHDFLLRELKMAKSMAQYNSSGEEEEEEDDFNEENFVRVPIEKVNENSEPIREYKTYKIIKSLDYLDSKVEPVKVDHGEIRDKIKLNESYDGIPYPSNYNHPTQKQLRNTFPNQPDHKFINEM